MRGFNLAIRHEDGARHYYGVLPTHEFHICSIDSEGWVTVPGQLVQEFYLSLVFADARPGHTFSLPEEMEQSGSWVRVAGDVHIDDFVYEEIEDESD